MSKKKLPVKKVTKPNKVVQPIVEEEVGDELTESQKVFCREWIRDYNGTRAYKVAYPTIKNDNAAAACASALLRNSNIRAHTRYLNDNIGEVMGITKEMIINEHRKLAFTDMSSFHNTWVTRKEFETLTADQRACISEISTQVKRAVIGKGTEDEEEVEVEFIKIKTWDKHKSIDGLTKMLGHEMVQQMINHNTNVNIEVEPTPEEAQRIRESLGGSI